MLDATETAYKNGYAQGVKEFAERLKKRSHICHMIAINEKAYQILEGDLANLVKEMTEESK